MQLIGRCNLCSLCCWSSDGKTRCEHLQMFTNKGWPHAGMCTVYEKRYHMMPIRMLDSNGVEQNPGLHVCAGQNTPLETAAIIEKGIGKGCSFEVVIETIRAGNPDAKVTVLTDDA